MKKLSIIFLIVTLFVMFQSISQAQMTPRQDVVWARTVSAGTINFDGKLDEAAWAKADKLSIIYGQSAGLPASGWRSEAGADVYTDPINATVKFLVEGNYLYIGFDVPDKWVGGTADWARWDAVLMSMKDKAFKDGVKQAFPAELFYTFWLAGAKNQTPTVGGSPLFWSGNTDQVTGLGGRLSQEWGNYDSTRTARMIAIWDAKFYTNGTSNDAAEDIKWQCEMRIDVTKFGYDPSASAGDFVMMNFSIWDGDYLIGNDPNKIAAARTWWQSPWANANTMNTGQVWMRPDIGLNSTLPAIGADVVIPNGSNYTDPVIDGKLDDAVWKSKGTYTWEMGWDRDDLRQTYPGTGPYMSGQYQPDFGKPSKATIVDPSHGKFYMFFKGKFLYIGADIDDQLIEGTDNYDATDGIMFNIMDRVALNDDNVGIFRKLRVSFAPDGTPTAYEYLPTLINYGTGTTFKVTLKGNSTVNDNNDIDQGYMVEMKIDLTKLGYPDDLGDHLIFVGMDLFDGDNFADPLANYGSRTWWFREHDGGPATPWGYLDPAKLVTAVAQETTKELPTSIKLYGNYPNPFNPATKIRFALPAGGDVTLKIYNSIGQEVVSELLSALNSGEHEYNFNASNLASGVYIYKLFYREVNTGNISASGTGKMILMK